MRVVLAAFLLVLGACTAPQDPTIRPPDDASPEASPTEATSAEAPVAWERIDASGPEARRDYSFTADAQGARAYLFGGRSGAEARNDLWVFDVEAAAWQQIRATGPSPRFGHNAAFIEGKLWIFGGQGGPSTFFNDLWAFDPDSSSWEVLPADGAPAPRYGAGGTVVEGNLVITHGFTNQGRFDDTWSRDGSWTDISPSSGPRPEKRCLLGTVHLESTGKMVLFGGQSNSSPFLSDTWLYDPATRSWAQIEGPAPSARNLYAVAATADRAYLFGGQTEDGKANDLWTFDGSRWEEVAASGTPPSPRSGVYAANLGDRLLVFGGAGEDGELDDLWQLTLS